MFDNVAFEVVIGLVFIYLLYSLLATIIGEIIATSFGIRQRLLRIAIERMFNDGYYLNEKRHKNNWIYFQSWLRKVFLYESKEFKYSFAGKFYNYPSIKYLSRSDSKVLFSSTKPAYITPEYFADSVINFLREKGSGATDMDRISFCLRFNTYHIQPKTLKQFRNLFENAAGNKDAYRKILMNWFNEFMDRNNGWYKRKMRFILFLLGILLSVAFNIDSIRISEILANDKEARSQLVSMGIELSKDSVRYNDFISANGDTIHSKAVLDSGLARVTKDINAANLVLGLGWDRNFDTLRKSKQLVLEEKDNKVVYKRLSADINLFDSLKTEEDKFLNKRRERLNSISLKRDSIQLIIPDTLFKSEQITFADNSKKQKLKDGLKKSQDSINAIQKRIQILQFENKQGLIKYQSIAEQINKIKYKINKATGNNFSDIDEYRLVDNTIKISGKRNYSAWGKLVYILGTIFCKYKGIGFIITALALCLGAPFWFGVLNKLVSLRGVGVNPDEKEEETKKSNPTDKEINLPVVIQKISEPVSDNVDAALQHYSTQIKAISGVKAVFTVIKSGVKQLQVNVDKAITSEEVNNRFSIIMQNLAVPFVIVESGIPKSHAGQKGLIENKSGKNGFGSLGCILTRKDTGSKHILSCWHVLKGDLDYSDSDDEPFIIDCKTGNDLAERWAGGITDQFDYGLAICNNNIFYRNNSFLEEKLNIQSKKILSSAVSKKDIDDQISIKYYNGINDLIVHGFVYASSDDVEIDYVDKTRIVNDVLLLTNENEKTISQEGNSGSIVFNEKNNAIAIIIGGDTNYTYALKLSYIFKIHSEMIIA